MSTDLEAIDAVMTAYEQNPTAQSAWAVALSMRQDVEKACNRLKARIPRNVELEDLVSAGLLTVYEAVPHFRRSFGTAFRTYANVRLHGGLMDYLRTLDGSRTARTRQKALAAAVERAGQVAGRPVGVAELAMLTGSDASAFGALQEELRRSRAVQAAESLSAPVQTANYHREQTLAGTLQDESNPSPDESAANRDAFDRLLRMLPDRRMRLVARLYCDADLTMREIGNSLGLSESRVSQLFSQAMEILRSRLEDT